jgi:hypothetical protein
VGKEMPGHPRGLATTSPGRALAPEPASAPVEEAPRPVRSEAFTVGEVVKFPQLSGSGEPATAAPPPMLEELAHGAFRADDGERHRCARDHQSGTSRAVEA